MSCFVMVSKKFGFSSSNLSSRLPHSSSDCKCGILFARSASKASLEEQRTSKTTMYMASRTDEADLTIWIQDTHFGSQCMCGLHKRRWPGFVMIARCSSEMSARSIARARLHISRTRTLPTSKRADVSDVCASSTSSCKEGIRTRPWQTCEQKYT